jgi:hypothetical protein
MECLVRCVRSYHVASQTTRSSCCIALLECDCCSPYLNTGHLGQPGLIARCSDCDARMSVFSDTMCSTPYVIAIHEGWLSKPPVGASRGNYLAALFVFMRLVQLGRADGMSYGVFAMLAWCWHDATEHASRSLCSIICEVKRDMQPQHRCQKMACS